MQPSFPSGKFKEGTPSFCPSSSNPSFPHPFPKNHIYWQPDLPSTQKQHQTVSKSKSKSKHKRRPIFQGLPPKPESPRPLLAPLGHPLPSPSARGGSGKEEEQRGIIDQRIDQINQQLNLRREEKASGRRGGEAKVAAEEESVLRSRGMKASKASSVGSGGLTNSGLGSAVGSYSASRYEFRSRLDDPGFQNESRLQLKEDELQRINAELVAKQLQLMRNRGETRKRDLELLRLKRIEELQKGNLALYHSAERTVGLQGSFPAYGQFPSLQQGVEEGVEGECWQPSQSQVQRSGGGRGLQVEEDGVQVLSPLSLSYF